MHTPHIADTETLWSQKFKLIPGLKAGSDGINRFFFERPGTSDRFVLTGWQMSMMTVFDAGIKSVGDVVRELVSQFPAEVNEGNVRQFCKWLIDTQLVEPNQPETGVQFPERTEPTVALVDQPVINPIARQTNPQVVAAPQESKKLKKAKSGGNPFRMILKIAACLAVGLGMWRFGTYVLPMLSAVGQKGTVMASNALTTGTKSTAAISIPNAPLTNEEMKSAGPLDLEAQLETLRHDIEACQKRRDACYNADDEEGYAEEIHKLADLTKKIGFIQAMIASEEGAAGGEPRQF